MKKAEFKTYGGEVAYAMFRWLFVILPVFFVIGLILFATLETGGGFLSYTPWENLILGFMILTPSFLTVMTLLWSVNYLLCRMTGTVKANTLDVIAHVLSAVLSVPGLIGLFDTLFLQSGGGLTNDLFLFSFLILPLWLWFGGYCMTRKIISRKRAGKAAV